MNIRVCSEQRLTPGVELIAICSGAADRRNANGQREGVSDGASAFSTEAEVGIAFMI